MITGKTDRGTKGTLANIGLGVAGVLLAFGALGDPYFTGTFTVAALCAVVPICAGTVPKRVAGIVLAIGSVAAGIFL
jgi:hypothetical protein